jgi:hypothetical protein
VYAKMKDRNANTHHASEVARRSNKATKRAANRSGRQRAKVALRNLR